MVHYPSFQLCFTRTLFSKDREKEQKRGKGWFISCAIFHTLIFNLVLTTDVPRELIRFTLLSSGFVWEQRDLYISTIPKTNNKALLSFLQLNYVMSEIKPARENSSLKHTTNTHHVNVQSDARCYHFTMIFLVMAPTNIIMIIHYPLQGDWDLIIDTST
jgi:hypothetical protein